MILQWFAGIDTFDGVLSYSIPNNFAPNVTPYTIKTNEIFLRAASGKLGEFAKAVEVNDFMDLG